MTEFDIIERFFHHKRINRPDVVVGIGDDAAVLAVPQNKQLITAMDTLVSGVHFFADADPADIAYKALAVNLSDLAAMAAEPAWFSLALTLPQAENNWLTRFAQGLFELAEQYQLQLIGGDTTRGPLSATIQIFGFADPLQAVRRDGAKIGDLIYVTGELGTAGFALQHMQTGMPKLEVLEQNLVFPHLLRPVPRVKEALILRDYMHAAIDVSDGLAADLTHILNQSGLGATIFVEKLPLSATVVTHSQQELAYSLALTSGDDYELCFTVSPENQNIVEQKLRQVGCPFSQIGYIESQVGLRCISPNGHEFKIARMGFQHFN